MIDFIVRQVHKTEEAARLEIVKAATQELRRTYRPRGNGGERGSSPSGVLVALKENMLVGTAEYVRKDDHLYIQGVAVHPEYRNQGVCRALVRAAERIGKDDKLTALALRAIEETGNVGVFKSLGFTVTNRTVAPDHVNAKGGPVIQVDMERKIAVD